MLNNLSNLVICLLENPGFDFVPPVYLDFGLGIAVPNVSIVLPTLFVAGDVI